MSFIPQIEAIIPLASKQVAKDWPQMCQMPQGTLASVLALPEEFVSFFNCGLRNNTLRKF